MNVLIIGMGYVGTTMGVAFAQAGHHVTGLDLDHNKIDALQQGKLYFHEPGVEEMLRKNLQHKRLRFTTDAKKAIESNDCLFITVGTPSLKDGHADLTYVKKAAEMIGRFKQNEKIVIVKSTVPIGTTEKVKQWVEEKSQHHSPVYVGMNPEFLREGSALHDALYPDRIVIGSDNQKVTEAMQEIYQNWNCPILQTTTKGAEMIKYASNAFLASKISFMNDMAKLCDSFGINIQDVSKGMGLDHRIGPEFLQAGLGYGGSCFPKDVKELLYTAASRNVSLPIIREAERTNQLQSNYFINKVKKHFSSLDGKRIVVYGLAFKPHTDDTRESVSFRVMRELLQQNATILVHDPVVQLSTDWIEKGIQQYSDPYEAVINADAILICTNWPEYEELNWAKVRENVRNSYVFDGRNMLKAEKIKNLQFHYEGIGYS